VAREPGAGGVLRVSNQGPGPLYVAMRHEGVSTATEPEVDHGVQVRRSYLTMNAASRWRWTIWSRANW
jgi:hypothetical protein